MPEDFQALPSVDLPPFFTESLDTVLGRILDPFAQDPNPEIRFDVRQGSPLYDLFLTPSLEFVQVYERLNQVPEVALLVSASGEYLDQKGVELNRPRLGAAAATVLMTVEGVPGLIIPAGTAFTTPTVTDESAQEYTADVAITLDANGVALVPATAVAPGIAGNVPAGVITELSSSIPGVSFVVNDSPARGGRDVESDDEYRGRLFARLRASGGAGNLYDYVDWVTQYDGVASAHVYPHWRGGGTVKVALIGPDRTVPPSSLIRKVQQGIDPSVVLMATMEADEPWTGAFASNVDKSEGQFSAAIEMTPSTTVTISRAMSVNLSWLAPSDEFRMWIGPDSTIGLTALRITLVDGAGVLAYYDFNVAALVGPDLYSWAYSAMTRPTTFNPTNVVEARITVTVDATSPSGNTYRFDSLRAVDSDGGSGGGTAPAGAQVTVSMVRIVPLTVTATVIPEAGYTVSMLTAAIRAAIEAYLPAQALDGRLYVTDIANVIHDTPGVRSYTNITLNGQPDAVTVAKGDLLELSTLSLS